MEDLSLDYWQPHRGRALELLSAGKKVLETPAAGLYDWAWVLGCPNWKEFLWRVATAARSLKPGAPLVMAVPRDQGADRLPKLFPERLWQDSKHKARVLAMPAQRVEGAPWLEAGALHRSPATDYYTCAGLYGWDKIDAGSSLLVENLPERLAGRVADLGCGYGYLSCAAAQKGCHQLEVVDVDRRALGACRLNLENFTCKCRYHWLDLTSEALPGLVDHVIMNAPFHYDAKSARELGLTFVERAFQALEPGGELWMVANQAIDYEHLLATRFQSFKELARRQGFKVLYARKGTA